MQVDEKYENKARGVQQGQEAASVRNIFLSFIAGCGIIRDGRPEGHADTGVVHEDEIREIRFWVKTQLDKIEGASAMRIWERTSRDGLI